MGNLPARLAVRAGIDIIWVNRGKRYFSSSLSISHEGHVSRPDPRFISTTTMRSRSTRHRLVPVAAAISVRFSELTIR